MPGLPDLKFGRVEVIEVVRFFSIWRILMKNRIFAASYQRGIELIAAGCPLDYPDALAGHAAAQHKPFRAEQLGGYVESRVYALGRYTTGYVIALRLGTDRPAGTIITEWGFAPPWPDISLAGTTNPGHHSRSATGQPTRAFSTPSDGDAE